MPEKNHVKKRILWHLPFAMIGGAETLYSVILKYINKTDYDHIVTCHKDIHEWALKKYRPNAVVYTFTSDVDLAKILLLIRPDLIMGTHGFTLYAAMGHAQIKTPIVEVVHGSHVWSEHNAHTPKNWTQHILCVSKTAERVYLKSSDCGIPTSVIINGVDMEEFYPTRSLQADAKVWGYIGRFMEGDKHVTQIISAFKSAGDHFTRLHLVGGSASEIVHLKHLARGMKVEQRVKFHEYTDQPHKHFKNIDLFTVRSEAEGYCNSAAEALACGIPTVCYNFGGLLEHVPEGTIAIANTQQEYAETLRRVHRDPLLRKKMRLQGLQFIQGEGNAHTMVSKYEGLIKNLLSKKVFASKALSQITKGPSLEITKMDMPFLGKVSISSTKPVVGVCNPQWHGIATATNNVCEKVVHWHKEPATMVKQILAHKPRAILFSGLCPGFEEAIQLLKQKHPEFPIYIYYHGGASHYSFQKGLFGDGERIALQKILDLNSRGLVKKIAVSSPGLDTFFKSAGYNAYFCGNLFKLRGPTSAPPKLKPGFHVGNWNRHHDHKHTSIGIAASQIIQDSYCHVLKGFPVLPGADRSRIIEHSEMPQNMLYDLYRAMTVNLQLSFIETFNISVLEMWSCRRPVILGPGNLVLAKYMIDEGMPNVYVEDHTNPQKVAAAIEDSAQQGNRVIEAQMSCLEKVNRDVSIRWMEFFN